MEQEVIIEKRQLYYNAVKPKQGIANSEQLNCGNNILQPQTNLHQSTIGPHLICMYAQQLFPSLAENNFHKVCFLFPQRISNFDGSLAVRRHSSFLLSGYVLNFGGICVIPVAFSFCHRQVGAVKPAFHMIFLSSFCATFILASGSNLEPVPTSVFILPLPNFLLAPNMTK